eukprot:6144193-Heterocapsa_arctica.AAC.1
MARFMRCQRVGHQGHATMQEDLPGRTAHRRDRRCERPPHQTSCWSHPRSGGARKIRATARNGHLRLHPRANNSPRYAPGRGVPGRPRKPAAPSEADGQRRRRLHLD